ncbi:serpin family protein [Faecalibaculum rodentium]|uniref:serpin family protein n=1 Tax=Faecalibaculum rodentium TaxID=1702221 RepID=UPI00259B7C90|nr:serpin family protein [Faecalibaculum rodentium]
MSTHNKPIARKLAGILSCSVLSMSLISGCASSESMKESDNLTANMEFKKVASEFSAEESTALADFSMRLFQNLGREDENLLLSGSSAWMALGMAANGAEGDTLRQMETVLGLNKDQINKAAAAWFSSMEDQNSLTMADSIWLKNEFRDEVAKSFLETCAQDFRAEVFSSTLDQKAVKDINDWTSKHTDGLIPELIKEIPSLTQMILVNAEAFNGKWAAPFDEADTKKQTFHNQDGSESSVDFLNGQADWSVENDNVTGFIKEYDESRYGYMLLLPKDADKPLSEAVNTLDGAAVSDLLSNRMSADVQISMPKLDQESTLTLNDALAATGMTDAFGEEADFSAITGSKNDLYISSVLQKTYIEVSEKGTKAAAATEIGIETMAMPVEADPVVADKPYVYMIVDLEHSMPLFVGRVVNIQE